MLRGIYSSGLAALGQSVRLGVVANNLANVQTPGFRRDALVFSERPPAALEDPPSFKYYNFLVDRFGGAPYIEDIQPDPNPGRYEYTGGRWDVAIRTREGFFAVQEEGTDRVFYTRAGNFLLRADGLLATADGRYLVLNPDGQPIHLPAQEDLPTVARDGRLLRGDAEVARIGVWRVARPEALRKYGDTLFEAPGQTPEVIESPSLEPGYLEMSSANPVAEMVELIATARAVEANLQMIRFQDAELERLINTVGRM